MRKELLKNGFTLWFKNSSVWPTHQLNHGLQAPFLLYRQLSMNTHSHSHLSWHLGPWTGDIPLPSSSAVNGALKERSTVRLLRELFSPQERPFLTLISYQRSNLQWPFCNCSTGLTVETPVIGPLWEIWNRRTDGFIVCIFHLFLP